MASPNTSTRVYYDELRSLGFAGLGAGYVSVGAPFAHPVYQLKVTNLTDANLIISYDGIVQQDVIPAKSSQWLDYNANQVSQAGSFVQSVGEQPWVKLEAAAATLGTVYFTVVCASNS